MSETDFGSSALPKGEELNESVDEILSQIMGTDGEMGESFSTLFTKYLGSEDIAGMPVSLNYDISDRTDEKPIPRQRVEYEDPENIPPPPNATERRISEKIPDNMRAIFSEAEAKAKNPEFTAEGTVKYPLMGSGEAEERVVFDADWEENAKKDAAQREAYRREQMLMGDSAYARNSGFIARSYGSQTDVKNKYFGIYPQKPNVNPAYIDPLSEVEDYEPPSRQSKNSRLRFPNDEEKQADPQSRIVYEAPEPSPTENGNPQQERTEDSVNTNSENNSFFPEGFSAKVNNNAVGGKTEATENIGEAAKKSIVDDAVLDAFANAADSEIAFRERWQSEVERAQNRKIKNEQLMAERLRREEARRLREERLASRLKANGNTKPVFSPSGTPAQEKPAEPETAKTEEDAVADEEKKILPYEEAEFEYPVTEVFKSQFSEKIPKSERLVGEKGNLLRSGAPKLIRVKKDFSQRMHYFKKTRLNKQGVRRLARRIFPVPADVSAEKLRKLIRLVSFVVLCGAFVYLAVYGVKYVKRVKLTHDIGAQISSLDNLTEEEIEQAWKNIYAQYPNVSFPEGMNVKYANLYAINQDVVGYLSIDNTNIQTVLLQDTSYDDYYLYRDIYKEKSRYGNPFVSKYSDMGKEGLSKNTIIYGHNTHDELMFNQLTRYMSVQGYLNAPIVKMDTLYESTVWKVFAVMLTNSTASADNGYVFDYLKTSFSSDSAFMSLMNALYERSIIHTGIDVQPTDNIMMLYTCYQNVFDGGRLVVCARQLRQGESTDIDTSKVYYNSNVHYPQAYYDAMGTVNPYYSGSQKNKTEKTQSDYNNTANENVSSAVNEGTDVVNGEGTTSAIANDNEVSMPSEASSEGTQSGASAESGSEVSATVGGETGAGEAVVG